MLNLHPSRPRVHDMIYLICFSMSLLVILAFTPLHHNYPVLSWIYGAACLAVIKFFSPTVWLYLPPGILSHPRDPGAEKRELSVYNDIEVG
jgi:hypothetical protein